MDSWSAADQAEIQWLGLVIDYRLTQSVAHYSTRLLRHQMRRRDVPFIAPAQGRHQIGTVTGYHRHPHRNAVRLGHRHQIAVDFGEVVGGNPAAGKCRARAAGQTRVVAGHAFACTRNPQLVLRWSRHHSKCRFAVGHQRHRHAPTAAAAHIIARAVNGIDQPKQPSTQACRIIHRFFGKPTRFRQYRHQPLLQQRVDLYVDVADGIAPALFPNPGVWYRAIAPTGHRQRACLARRSDDGVAIKGDHIFSNRSH